MFLTLRKHTLRIATLKMRGTDNPPIKLTLNLTANTLAPVSLLFSISLMMCFECHTKQKKKIEIQFSNYLLSVFRTTYNVVSSRQNIIWLPKKKQKHHTYIHTQSTCVSIINRWKIHFFSSFWSDRFLMHDRHNSRHLW